MPVQYVAVDDAEGQRLDNFLLRELAGVPRSHVYRLLRRGEVRVNGGRAAPDYRLQRGDRVRLPPHRKDESVAARPSAGLIDWLERSILFEDDQLLVLNKPCGVAVHGGSGVASGVIEALRARVASPERSNRRLELAHRLDRDTSGCLVLAKSRQTLMEWHTAFRDSRVSKTYDVLVHGRWPRKQRTVELRLTRQVTRTGERRVKVAADGKSARTDFEVNDVGRRGTYLECHPHTGRTHQIRVHCVASGHAIVGDTKYANDEQLALAKQLGIRRLCLHASSLAIVTKEGKRRRFVAPAPEDFLDAWASLKT